MKLDKVFRGDKIIWVVFMLLSIVSLIEVFSSIGLFAYTYHKDPMMMFVKHLAIVVVTYVAVILISRINYRHMSRIAVLAFWAVVVLLAVVMAMHTRWLVIPKIGQFQPSEVAKVVMVIFLAKQIAVNKDRLNELSVYLRLLIYIIAVCVLTFPEGFSTSALIFSTGFLLLLFGNVSRRYWWRTVAVIVLAGGIVVLVGVVGKGNKVEGGQAQTEVVEQGRGNGGFLHRVGIWGQRLVEFNAQDDDALTQANYSKMAINRGGLFGVGVGGTVYARLAQEAHNDFVYAIIIEELGSIVGIIVFLLYCIFYFRCIRVSSRCEGTFGSLMVAGIGTVIFLQALTHICVAVGVIPVTGQTLPFVSFGGTSYIILGCGLGIIQAVAHDVKLQERKKAEAEVERQDESVVAPQQEAIISEL